MRPESAARLGVQGDGQRFDGTPSRATALALWQVRVLRPASGPSFVC